MILGWLLRGLPHGIRAMSDSCCCVRSRWKLGLFLILAAVFFLVLKPEPTTLEQSMKAPEEDLSLVAPEAGGIELLHPEPVEIVYVLLHGVTNHPGQFRQFGELLYAQGDNVLIPRMPFHGHRDRLTDQQRYFNAGLALRETNAAIDRAQGLGRRVVVVGLSVNALPAAWVAMNRPEVDATILLAPFFSAHGLSDFWLAPAVRFFLRWPNFFVWWDAALREELGKGTLVYPRFPTRTMASFLRFGLEIFKQAREQAPVVRRVLIVTTAADQAINNQRVEELGRLWRAEGFTGLETYQFPEDEEIPHDFIDPGQPDQKTEVVYPKLLELFSETLK